MEIVITLSNVVFFVSSLMYSRVYRVCLWNYKYNYTSLKNMSRRSVFWHCSPSKRSGLFQWTSVGMTLMWIFLSVRNGQLISFQLQII